jgi:hypothetical protein
MQGEILLGLFLRLLPTILLIALAFIAAADKNSREQWANLMHQIGSIKPAQKSDPKVQSGVRWPFIAVAVIFLIWPLRYYQHATKTIEVQSNPFEKAATSNSPVFGNAASENTAAENGASENATSENATSENPAADSSGGQSPMFN